MTTRRRVVVAGMGDTGVLVAVNLGRAFDVVGISTKPALVSGQELGLRVASPDRWRRNYLTPLGRFTRLDRVRALHGRIDRIDTDDRQVHVELADGRRVIAPYDVLVISSGVTNGFWRQNRVEDLDAIEAGIDAVATQIAAAGSLAVVGGGATGVSVAANVARRHPGTDVHLFFGHDEPLPGYHPKVRHHVVRTLERAGVHLHPGHRAAVPDGFDADRLTTGPVEWSTGQPPFAADVVFWAIGSVRPNNDFVPADMLDENGFVRVDEHLRVPGHPDVFAVGDIAATDPHRSSARNWGARLVARNIKALARGREDQLRAFEAPEHRWGSIIGPQDDGMVVYQPNGASFRVPPWAVQPILFDLITKVGIYRGVRRSSPDRSGSRAAAPAGAAQQR